MQNTQNLINFKKERDFGELISDTFGFIKQNYKALFKVIVKVAGPIMLLTIVSYLVYNFIIFGGNSPFSNNFDIIFEEVSGRYTITFMIGVVFMMVVSILFYAIFYAVINYSIQSYIEHDGEINIEEVSDQVRAKWSSFFGLTFVTGIMMFFGFLLCVLPGIYLAVPLSLTYAIMVFKNLGVSDSISYSFRLIKSNWWVSFFTLLVMLIFYYIIVSIFQIPSAIFTMVKVMTVDGNSPGVFNWSDFSSWMMLIFSGLVTVIQFFLFGFLVVTSSFIYFNLDEKLNRTGAFESIDRLGNDF